MQLYDVLNGRRDTRRQFTGTPLCPVVLQRVLSAAQCAPSIAIDQPWDFVLVRSPIALKVFAEHVELEREMFSANLDAEHLEAFNRLEIDGILESGLGIVVGYDATRSTPSVRGRNAISDAGLYSVVCAIQNIWLAATEEGLGVSWVSFYREEFLRSLVGMPDHMRPVAWLSLGTVEGMSAAPDSPRSGWRHLSPLASVLHEEYYDAAGGLSA